MMWLLALVSQASVCSLGDAILEGPVPLVFQEGRFGSPRPACPTTEVALSAGTNLTADVDDFYGNIRAFGLLEGSYRLDRFLAVFVEIEVVRYQTVISSLSATSLGFGHTSLGTTYVLFPGTITVSGSARLTLPTTSDYYTEARPLALDAAFQATTWVTTWLELHGELGMLGSVGTGNGPLDARGGFLFGLGATWRPSSWFALIADLSAELLYAHALDHFAAGGGVRFLVGGLGIDLFAAAPLAGHDRTTVAGLLRLRYDFR